jgi:hypothetical protein
MSLFKNPNGRFSASKMWTNIAYAVSTYVIIERAPTLDWELLLVYMAVVGGSEIAKKYLNMRVGSTTSKDDP